MTGFDRSTARRATPLVNELLTLMTASRPPGIDHRVWDRVGLLTLGSVIALGRHTLSQVLVALGLGSRDWSAWYRLFNRRRFSVLWGRPVVLGRVLAWYDPGAPLAVVVDATQLPRSSRRFPGVGATRAPRCPVWRPGVHLAQRVELLSLLLPRTPSGDSRAVPLHATVLRTERTRPFGSTPVQTECAAAGHLLAHLRDDLDASDPDREVLVVADGAYSTAPMLTALPDRTTLLARCALNRALYAMPVHCPGARGRKRRYGERGPTPLEQLHAPRGWHRVSLAVRGRTVTPRVQVTGPWLVKPVPHRPVFILVVKGVDRGHGRSRRQRAPHFFLVTARIDPEGTPVLPFPVADLLAWCWQRWEVEVMHKELKSSCGLGDQQAWSAAGAATTLDWALWTYALLILAGAAVWGLGPAPGPDSGRWWRPRRWSVPRLMQEVRAELWQPSAQTPDWSRFPDAWGEMETWIPTQTSAALGIRHV